MLCNDRRASSRTTSALTGGGGGFSNVTCVEACPVSPRESVQVAVTVTGPAGAPPVLRVAELPLPETVPAEEVQLATETGTPSGLVQEADRFTLPPVTRSVGLADNDMVGGFFGGNGFTVKLAVQLASLFLVDFGSVTCAVIV